MIVTLAGENSFRLQAELNGLLEVFLGVHGGLALERIDGQEADFDKIREALTGLPFLAARKMVVLRAPSANKQFTESFEQLLNDTVETTDLILVEPKLDKRMAYYKLLKKKTDFREFPELDAGGLARWLVESARAGGGSLGLADASYLVERVGPNQQLLSNELDKLLLYDSNINRRNIDLLTEPTPQSTIFQLLEAAFAGRSEQALKLYAEQRALKVEPPQIVAMLAWQLHVLAVIKAAGDRSADEIAREAKLNPFVVRKSQGIARGLTLAEVKELVSDLLKIDVASKRTSIDSDEALQNYLLALSRV
ncbi:MAG TPA: DNA polymerase III subunit delta [Candidatus Dormibacteraeota bacterium]|nr:DNA polymerase III subunit delta [Candidatus Dormibacteraeota bacterium]